MKSRVTFFSLLLALMLLAALPAFAKQHGQGQQKAMGGMGMMGCMGGNATDPEFLAKVKQYQEETKEIRRSLVADWTELEAVLNAQNPDAAKARLLREKIFDTHQKLREAAEKAGLAGGCGGMGGGMGGGCGGGCGGGMGRMMGGGGCM